MRDLCIDNFLQATRTNMSLNASMPDAQTNDHPCLLRNMEWKLN